MAKPSTLPVWAWDDQTDPDSGQPNVATPDIEFQQYGWRFKQKPPRQYFNWLFRWIYNWLKWLDDNFEEGTVPMRLRPSGTANFTSKPGGSIGTIVDGDIHFDMPYRIHHDIINMIIPGAGVYGTLDLACDLSLEIQDGESFPITFNWAGLRCAPIVCRYADPTVSGNILGEIEINEEPTKWNVILMGITPDDMNALTGSKSPNSGSGEQFPAGSYSGIRGQVIQVYRLPTT